MVARVRAGAMRSLVVAAMLLAGRSATAGTAETATALEKFNAWAHDFNRAFVATTIEPVVNGTRQLPAPVQAALGNAFSNLSEPVSALSHLMASDAKAATQTTARFAVNSTLGLLGTIDVATPMGLPMRKKRFSEGVCAMGLPVSDAYMVVPGVGPSTAGIAAAGVFVMVGSTVALSFVSMELALASIVADGAASAAALESAAATAHGPSDPRADETALRAYLARIGC